MKKIKMLRNALFIGLASATFCGAAHASLTTFQTFVGPNGLSTGGCGSTTQTCTFTSVVPTGSIVLGAYLYSSLYSVSTPFTPTGTLNGNSISFSTALGLNVTGGNLQAYRADVTSIVAPLVAGALMPTLSFTVTENSALQDGEALVIVYSNAALPTQTVAILDGFSATTGDSASINFTQPLHPGDAGFVADFRIGDGFSFDAGCTTSSQVSRIDVNAQRLTNVAGCNDDNVDASSSNGNLFTIGGDNDPYTPFVVGGTNNTATDHERYNLIPYIADGSSTIVVSTLNPSNDDNIFLEAFVVSGIAGVNAAPPTTGVPEPATALLLGVGLVGLKVSRRRRWSSSKRGTMDVI